MATIGTILGKAFLEMLMRLLGYKFISEATVLALDAWAKSTENHNDDKVVAAIAKALEVPLESLK